MIKNDILSYTYLNHVMELVNNTISEDLDHPKMFVEEIFRILKPGGVAFIETPHFSNYVAYTDPQHKLYYSYFMFRKFIEKFKDNYEGNKKAMILFEMLEILKNINLNGEEFAAEQQADFNRTYQDVKFDNWDWQEIEKWIETKDDKTKLLAAVTFFKNFDQS